MNADLGPKAGGMRWICCKTAAVWAERPWSLDLLPRVRELLKLSGWPCHPEPGRPEQSHIHKHIFVTDISLFDFQ